MKRLVTLSLFIAFTLGKISAADMVSGQLLVDHLNEKCSSVTIDSFVYECVLFMHNEESYTITLSCRDDSDARANGFGMALNTWLILANKNLITPGKKLDTTYFSERPHLGADNVMKLSILLRINDTIASPERPRGDPEALPKVLD